MKYFILISLLSFFTCLRAFNIQRQSIGASAPNSQQPLVQSNLNSSSTGVNGNNSQLNGTRGFVLEHQLDSLSVEKQKAEEKIEYHEFPETRATAKNKIVNLKSNKKSAPKKKLSAPVNQIKTPKHHMDKNKPSIKYQQVPDASAQAVAAGQNTQNPNEDDSDQLDPTDQQDQDMENQQTVDSQQPDMDAGTESQPQQAGQPIDADAGAEQPQAAPDATQDQTDQAAAGLPQDQQSQDMVTQQPQVSPAPDQPLQNDVATTPMNAAITQPAGGDQQPPNPIDSCPSEVESLGCFNYAAQTPGSFDTMITTKTPTQSLEEFFCACGSMVQNKGWGSFMITEDSCYSSQSDPDYQSAGESLTCVNESGSQCTDDDTYCQGSSDSMTVYKIISAKHRSKLSKKAPKKN